MKNLKKAAAVFMAVILFSLCAINIFAATSTAFSEPVPLLIIQISFDANGNGTDDNIDGANVDSVKDPESEIYGEQWCHTTEEEWESILFAEEGASLLTYYKYNSDGKFWFSPAKETYGKADNGVIHVVLDNVHPNCIAGTGQWVHCYKQIIAAADEFVDFASYDANGNGSLDKYELGLCFIIGGAETSSGATTETEPFGFHAYYKQYDANNTYVADGVTVAQSGFFGTGAISNGAPLTFGVFAHELGHYLGAPDLYDASTGRKYDYAVGTLSLMAKGAHGSDPAHIDAWNLLKFGFYEETVVTSGEYTLYSKASQEGDYNILKVCTPNPDEYFLIENRYTPVGDEEIYFDGSANMHQGIIIYHVDEDIFRKTGMTCNEAGDGYDPTIVAYSPNATKVASTAIPAAFTNGKVFKATSYEFPKGKWYTGMTKSQASVMENFQIEILSDAGTEMKIRITGADCDPDLNWTVSAFDIGFNEFSVKGSLTYKFYKTVEEFSVAVSEKESGKEIVNKTLDLSPAGLYETVIDGLSENTAYTYTFTAKTADGTFTSSHMVFTKAIDYSRTSYIVSAYRNLGSNDTGARDITVNLGEKLSYSFPMSRTGYAFAGWYLDEKFTEAYDMNFTQDIPVDFSIYAKWLKSGEAATIKIEGAELIDKIFAVEVGETFAEPNVEAKEGFKLEGWYLDADFTKPFDFSTPVSEAGTVTVYANWVDENAVTSDDSAQTQDAGTEPTASSSSMAVIVIVAVIAVVAGAAVAAVIIVKKKRS